MSTQSHRARGTNELDVLVRVVVAGTHAQHQVEPVRDRLTLEHLNTNNVKLERLAKCNAQANEQDAQRRTRSRAEGPTCWRPMLRESMKRLLSHLTSGKSRRSSAG